LPQDLGAAVALAFTLVLVWALRDWPQLATLRLPDTDDALRLQQIRDWVDGQAFNDLRQHRLGATPGLILHWSRLPDLVPAALIAGLTPITGAHGATLAAVILWPAMLFAAALMLVAGIARTLTVPAGTAMLVAAIAYPASSLFLPGRIDHHGLQLVLLLATIRSAVGTGTLGLGIAAGLASAASIAIGLETLPLLAIGGAALVLQWIGGTPGAQPRLLGYGVGLSVGLALSALALRGNGWLYLACDGFTAIAWRAAQLGAAVPFLLAAGSAVLDTVRVRVLAAIGCAVALGVLIAATAPQCTDPYGAVDPLLHWLWLDRVAEAQPLFTAALGAALAYAGLMLVGIVASTWQCWTTRRMDWAVLLAVQLGALGLTLTQLRGAYAGALLGVPALAALIAHARARGTLALIGAWLVSAGPIYPLLASAVPAKPVAVPAPGCTDPDALAALAALPPGRLMAPIDLGAFALAASPLDVIGAPYHRNQAGNLATYRFFLGSPAKARVIAAKWQADYVAWCKSGLGSAEDAARHGALATALSEGRTPDWLVEMPAPAPLRLYRVGPARLLAPSQSGTAAR
jgi:hypothetical protein